MDSISPDTPQKQCSQCPNSYPVTAEFFGMYKMKNGKYSFRLACKKCRRAQCTQYAKQYRQTEKNKEYRKQHGAQSYQAHREERIEQALQNYEFHKEEINANRRQRRKDRPDEISGIDRAHKHKRKAQKKAGGGSYTPQQLQEQKQRQKGKCYYCKAKLSKWHADHVVPLSKGGSNDISNIVITCPLCNMHKHDKLLHEWPEGNRLL